MSSLGTPDAELAARIKAGTLKKIGVQPARRRVRVRTLLLAAAIAAFFGSAACAVVRYNMNFQDVQDQDEVVTGHITEINKNGDVVNDKTLHFPDAGMVLTFTGPDESYNRPESRPIGCRPPRLTEFTGASGRITSAMTAKGTSCRILSQPRM